MAPTSIAVIGWGLRGKLAIIAYITHAVVDRWSGKDAKQYGVNFEIYDMQAKNAGPGNAFQAGSDAVLNSGLAGPIPFDKGGLSQQQIDTLNDLTDWGKHYAEIARDTEDILGILEARNTSAALVYSQNFKDGKLDTTVACGPRNIAGIALNRMTEKAINLAKGLKALTINIHYNSAVTHADFATNPRRPVLKIENKSDFTIRTVTHDFVLKSTGTTSKSPVEGEVADNAYTALPSADRFRSHLRNKGLLDEDDEINPGTRMVIVGLSLSALDFLGLILARTSIVAVDPRSKYGFTIDKEEARQYQGLITFINRSQGDVAPARHSNTPSTPEEVTLFTPRMRPAERIQKDSDPYFESVREACIQTAMGLKMFPNKVEPNLSTPEKLRRMTVENKALADDPSLMTPTKLFRSSVLGYCFGGAGGPDPAAERAKIARDLPLLKDEIWHEFRSMSYEATHGTKEDPQGGERHLTASKIAMAHLTSPPRIIHLLFTELLELGVVKWNQASAAQVSWSQTTKRFVLDNFQAHVMIAPSLLTDETDHLAAQIIRQAKEQAPGEGVYGKGRIPTLPSGKRMHVMELGLAGHGKLTDLKTVKARQWLDTNSADAGYDLMPKAVHIIQIIITGIARGEPSPVESLMKRYRQSLPSANDFLAQALTLEEDYVESHTIKAFSELLQKVCGSGGEYSAKMKLAQDPAGRNGIISEIGLLGGDANEEALSSFNTQVEQIKFNPLNLEQFERTTPDFSTKQIDRMRR
ncbi:unnamed protein product [Calypogeia fissa]